MNLSLPPGWTVLVCRRHGYNTKRRTSRCRVSKHFAMTYVTVQNPKVERFIIGRVRSCTGPCSVYVQRVLSRVRTCGLLGTERACNPGRRIINIVSRWCSISYDKAPGSAIRNITIPATHQKYTCTMKENTSTRSLRSDGGSGWKALGSRWRLSTCRKESRPAF